MKTRAHIIVYGGFAFVIMIILLGCYLRWNGISPLGLLYSIAHNVQVEESSNCNLSENEQNRSRSVFGSFNFSKNMGNDRESGKTQKQLLNSKNFKITIKKGNLEGIEINCADMHNNDNGNPSEASINHIINLDPTEVAINHNINGKIKLETPFDKTILGNQEELSKIIGNIADYTEYLAMNEKSKKEFIDEKINATKEIAGLASEISIFVGTSEKIIGKIAPEDVKQIVTNINHITKKLRAFVSKLNVNLKFVNRILKHIEPRAIPTLFKNIEKIKTTLNNQSQTFKEFNDEFKKFVEELKTIKLKIEQKIESKLGKIEFKDNNTEILTKIDEKIGKIIGILESFPSPENTCCGNEIPINWEELNELISEIRLQKQLINNNIKVNGVEFTDELTSLLRKLDEFFGTGVDSLLQLEEE